MTKRCKPHDLDKQTKQYDNKSRKRSKRQCVINTQELVKKGYQQFWNLYEIIQQKQFMKQGGYGTVKKAMHRQSKQVRAIKILNKKHILNKDKTFDANKQIQLLMKLDHLNIIQILQYYQTQKDFIIVTEFLQGKQLFQEILQSKRLSQDKAIIILRQVIKALIYIHKQKIVHRDINPRNILVKKDGDGYIVKVIDWGLSSLTDQKGLTKNCGTYLYTAPQVFSHKYNLQCDMWSLGVLTYIMLSGKYPFKASTRYHTIQQIQDVRKKIDFRQQQWNDISLQAKSFISKLLQRKITLRMKAQQALQHPWILSNLNNSSQSIRLKTIRIQKNLQQTLIRLKEHNNKSTFQLFVLNFILNYVNIPKQIQTLKEQFQLLDENHDGSLSRQQLINAYKKIYIIQAEAEAIVDRIFKKMDMDGSGFVTWSQYVTVATKIYKFKKGQLRQAFQIFDKDHNGQIDIGEIKNMIRYNRKNYDDDKIINQDGDKQKDEGENEQEDEDELKDIFDQIDANSDGKIDFNQFVFHMNKAISKVQIKLQTMKKKYSLQLSTKKSSQVQKYTKRSKSNDKTAVKYQQ